MRITIFRDYPEEEWKSMEVYADNLAKALSDLREKNLIIKEFVGLEKLSKIFPKNKKGMRYFFRYIVNPPLAFLNQGEVNHIVDQANAHLLAFLNPKKTIVTCHDLIVPFWLAKHRKVINLKRRIKYKMGSWRVRQLERAAKVITVSEATKREIVNTLKIDKDKITVIPEGVQDCFRRIENKNLLNSFKEKHRLPDKFVLYVGSCEEYKNIEGLLGLFSYLVKNNKDLYLVKVGHFWKEEQLKIVKKLNLGKKIKFLGYVRRRELPFVYNLATCLLQLSFIEGFGLTVLEAMACGCPVIVSNTSALKELVADAGLVFDINNKGRVLKNVQKIIDNKKMRDKYIEKGLKRAKLFTWRKTARKTYQVYKELFYKEDR